MNNYPAILNRELLKLQIHLSPETLQKSIEFIELVLDANKSINLTAITDFREALIKHVYDSLVILNYPEYIKAGTILDVGSGAGIPCFPLAISSPEKNFISLDSTQKKVRFQEDARQALFINNLLPIWRRAEDYIKQNGRRETFDLVLARAVAPVNVLAELTLPYAKVNGTALFYKGQGYQEELVEGERALSILGGRIDRICLIDLPMNYGTRALISIRKEKPTPSQYPRKAGTPSKNPLK